MEPVRPEENAAPFYRQLKGKFVRVDDPTKQGVTVIYGPPVERIKARKLLERYRNEILIVEEAVTRPKCWFDRNWSDGYAVLQPELSDMKWGARLLTLRASLSAAEGRVGDAIRDLRLVSKIGSHARQEPLIIAQLVSESIDLYAMRRLADCSFRYRKPEYVAELARMLKARREPDPKRENSDVLFSLLSLIELGESKEGLDKLGIKEEDKPTGIYRAFELILDKGEARIDLIKSTREWWEAIEAPSRDRLARMDIASQKQFRALLAFPTVGRVYEMLSAGNEPIAYRREHWRASHLKYRAVVRALSRTPIPKTIRTDDLLSPFDGKPISYRFDGKQIVIEVSGLQDLERAPSPLKIPPDQ